MNLDKLRVSIDSIDEQIVKLINERCKLAAKVGEWKKQRDHAIYVPEREKQLFEKLHAKNSGPIPSSTLRSIYREIISGAIALEKPLKILCLEESETAARETFGDAANYTYCQSINKLMEKLKSDEFDYGVIAFSNDDDTLSKTTLTELILHSHNKEPRCKHQEIKETHLLDNQPEKATSTGGIKICAERIGAINEKRNGRFFIIGMQETTPSSEDRTSLTVNLSNMTNKYREKLKSILKEENIFTITELDHSDIADQILFLEIAGHPTDKATKKILNKISQEIGEVKIVGGYPVLYA